MILPRQPVSTKWLLLARTRGLIFFQSFVSRGGVLELRRVGGRRILVGPDVIRVWRRKQWYDGPFNPSSTPSSRDANSLPPLGEGFRRRLGARWSSSRTCEHYMDRIGGLGLLTRFEKWRVCRASKGVYNLSDGIATATTVTHATYNIDTLSSSTRWMRRTGRTEKAGGGKTHR